MKNRQTMSHAMLGAKAPASDATPKIARLNWYANLRPFRSPSTPAAKAPISMPMKVDDRKVAFDCRVDHPERVSAPSTPPAR